MFVVLETKASEPQGQRGRSLPQCSWLLVKLVSSHLTLLGVFHLYIV